MQASHLGIIHVEAGEGQAYWVGTGLVTCKAGSSETEGPSSLPDLAQMAAIARKHDLEVVGPPVQ